MTTPAKEPAPNSFRAIDANRSAISARLLLVRAATAILHFVTFRASSFTFRHNVAEKCLVKSTAWVLWTIPFLARRIQNGYMTAAVFRINLAKMLAAKELTHAALAKKVGRSVSTVTKWLNGDREPSFDDLGHLAKALDVSVPQFFISPTYSANDLTADEMLIALSNAIKHHGKPTE